MCERPILTQVDQLRLREMIDHLRTIDDCSGPRGEYLELLRQRVCEAHVVEQRQVPRDVVTMNSLFVVHDLETDARWNCSLAYPQEADQAARKVSVAVPLGTLMLGRRAGQTVVCPAAWGKRTLRIDRLDYQPEAAGDYHL